MLIYMLCSFNVSWFLRGKYHFSLLQFSDKSLFLLIIQCLQILMIQCFFLPYYVPKIIVFQKSTSQTLDHQIFNTNVKFQSMLSSYHLFLILFSHQYTICFIQNSFILKKTWFKNKHQCWQSILCCLFIISLRHLCIFHDYM